jgi:hypothetical protein
MPYIAYGSCLEAEHCQVLRELFHSLEEFAIENNCLALSICTHPLSTVTVDRIHEYFDYTHAQKNFCQISKITGHPILSMNHHRRMAFSSEIARMNARPEFFIDKDPERNTFEAWYEIYKMRILDLGSKPLPHEFYVSYYQGSKTCESINFWVVRSEYEVIGGVFITTGKNIADYGTSAFDTAYRHLYPTTFLLNAYFHEAIRNGTGYFNWQSSPDRAGGVFKYKQRWGAEVYEHYYLSKTLVDLKELTSIPLSAIRHELAGSYLLPFSLWGEEIKKT